MMAKKSGHGDYPVRWLIDNQNRLRASSGKCFSSFALNVRSFIAVNQIRFRSFINGSRERTNGSGRNSFITSGDRGECFFAKCFDAAFRGAIALRANFGLTDTLLC